MNEIEKLKEEKDAAWLAYDKLRGPADAAYRKHEQANTDYKEAVMYEKAKRQVIRELINSAGKAAKMQS